MMTAFQYPADGALMKRFRAGDFLDWQDAELPDPSLSVGEIAMRSFFDPPGWVMPLLALRNALVGPFGLRTGKAEGFSPETAEELTSGRFRGIFALDSLSETEITFGADDKHLDFRGSVLKFDGGRRVAISTWVRPHHLAGRAYLAMVYPFHRLIIGAMLRRLAGVPARRAGAPA